LAKDKRMRVVEVRDMMAGKDVWPRVGMLEDGSVKHAPSDAPADATPEEIRTPAPPRRAGEQCFPEREKYLGPDHHDARSRSGRHRHILFTFMAHPFINKLRRTRGIKVDSPPAPAPFIEVPAPTEDYRNAVVETLNDRPISHPRTGACPKGPRRILTGGPVKVIIRPLLRTIGESFEKAKYSLKSASDAFRGHSKAKVEKPLNMGGGKP
jgi:hypothetical protein